MTAKRADVVGGGGGELVVCYRRFFAFSVMVMMK